MCLAMFRSHRCRSRAWGIFVPAIVGVIMGYG